MSESVRAQPRCEFGQHDVTITVIPAGSGPVVGVGDVTMLEGNSTTRALTFPVTRSAPGTSQVTVNYAITGATATIGAKKAAGVDAIAKAAGSLVCKVAAGKTPTLKPVVVSLIGDTTVETSETFTVTTPTGCVRNYRAPGNTRVRGRRDDA